MGPSVDEFAPPPGKGQVLPLIVLAAACCLVALWCVFANGLIGTEWHHYPLILSAIMLGFISIFEIRIGLAVLLLAIGISPDFTIVGISNFRYEDLIFPFIFFVWITKQILTREKFAPTDLKAPILLILLFGLITTLNNHIHGDLPLTAAALRFGKVAEYYLMFVVVLNCLKDDRDARSFALLMLLTSAWVGLYGLTQLGLDGQASGFRVSGPPGETANILGGYYVFHICLACGILSFAPGRYRLFILGFLLLLGLPFVHTLSRTSYVALSAGMIVIWVCGRNPIIGLALLLFAVLTLLMPGDEAQQRLYSIFGIFSGDPPSSWAMRVAGWKMFLSSALKAPLFGRGVGRAALGAVDNEYVLQINEVGAVGLLVFLWFIFRCLVTSYRAHRVERADPLMKGFALGYFGGCAALLIHSIGATTFTTIRTTEPFFFATGILYAYWNFLQKREKAERGKSSPDGFGSAMEPGYK